MCVINRYWTSCINCHSGCSLQSADLCQSALPLVVTQTLPPSPAMLRWCTVAIVSTGSIPLSNVVILAGLFVADMRRSKSSSSLPYGFDWRGFTTSFNVAGKERLSQRMSLECPSGYRNYAELP